MKKLFIISFISLAILVAAYLVTGYAFPKSLGRFPGFVALFLADLYLFYRTKPLLKGLKDKVIRLLSIGHWIPAICITLVVLVSAFLPYQDWNIPFRTYLTGFILISYMFKAVAAGLILLTDLGLLAWKIERMVFGMNINPEKTEKRKILAIKTSLSIAFVVLIIFVYGMFNIYNFVIRDKTIMNEHLPSSFEGFTIVQVSDIHLGSWSCKNRLRAAVEKINEIKPDIIFFTGDLLNYNTSEAAGFETILAGLKARHGIFTVTGNHDYGDYVHWDSKEDKEKNFSDLKQFYHRLGWKFLLNEHSILKIHNDSIAIIGVENWSDISRFPKKGKLDKAIRGAEQVPVKILLSHDPKHWNKIVKNYPVTIDITLSGHTHAFQMAIITEKIRWSPSQWLYPEWAGWYETVGETDDRTRWLNVNAGLGTIGYPGRIGIRPEITVIRLEKL